MSDIKLDLNERERRRYAESAFDLSKRAQELGDALIAGDDTTVLVNVVTLSLMHATINELARIVADNAKTWKIEQEAKRP